MDDNDDIFLEMARLGSEGTQHLGSLAVRTPMCANNSFGFDITIHMHLYLFNMYHIP